MDAKRDSLYFRFRAFVEGDITDNIPDNWHLYKFIISTDPTLKIVINRRECHDIGLVREDGKCAICLFEKYGRVPHVDELSPRQIALRDGQKWYTPDKHCPTCNTLSPRYVATGRCSHCNPPRTTSDTLSPRQIAMRNGEKWYIPIEPCPHCGKVAERHVFNGMCRGCYPSSRGTSSARQIAMGKGEKWYTPETPCKYCGKLEKRYVANGRCWCQNPKRRDKGDKQV